MNRNGRLVGGVLVGVALLWLLRILGALPFSDRTTNQFGQNQASAQIPPDRPPIADFDANRATPIGGFNPQNPNQPNPDLQNPNPQDPNQPNPNLQNPNPQNPQEVAQNPNGNSTRPVAPVVPGAW